MVSLPSNPDIKPTGIRFEEVIRKIENELNAATHIEHQAEEHHIHRRKISAHSQKPLIISAATVDEDTPELKPIIRSLKVSPARRNGSEAAKPMKAPFATKTSQSDEKSFQLPKSQPRVSTIEKSISVPVADAAIQPVEKPAPSNGKVALTARSVPDTFIPTKAISTELQTGQPVSKSVFFSPTGSRSTASLPTRSPVQVESASDRLRQSPQPKTETESDSELMPGNQKFVRTSMDVLKNRRPDPNKLPEEEWR